MYKVIIKFGFLKCSIVKEWVFKWYGIGVKKLWWYGWYLEESWNCKGFESWLDCIVLVDDNNFRRMCKMSGVERKII